jgi:hypothetical protein
MDDVERADSADILRDHDTPESVTPGLEPARVETLDTLAC